MADSTDVMGFYELASETYSEDQLADFAAANEPINLELTDPIPLQLGFGWCSPTPEILEENLANIEFLFEVNGQIIPDSNKVRDDYTADDGWACTVIYSIIDNWTSGKYVVSQTINILAAFSDGEYEYSPGIEDIQEYVVVVP